MKLKEKIIKNTSKRISCQGGDGVENQNISEVEEEPPGQSSKTDDHEEPPGKKITGRHKLFGHIPDNIWNDWKWQFRNRITSVNKLAGFIPISTTQKTELRLVTLRYPLSITPYYLSLINPDDPDDPIRKQAIPSILEITMGDIGKEDPLQEERYSVAPGLVHRYPDRVLMLLTDICPMLCRHCTRKREWRKGSWIRTADEIEAMIEYIRRHRAIRDVIISGGDPLSLSTHYLEFVLSRIRAIPHVEIIRIGTRFPAVLPQRVDNELCSMLSRYGPIWLNTHFNNHREITTEAAAACDLLLRSGVPVNNQSVLLRGVNDSIEEQTKLCHSLLKIKVRPYYLFQCDEVQGTEHLRTPVEVGINIIKGMRGFTSGLAVPTFVIDLPRGGGKVPVQPDYMVTQTEDELLVTNYQGHVFRCHNPKNGVYPLPEAVFAAEPLPIKMEGARDADRVVV